MTQDYNHEQADSLKRVFQEWKEAASEWITFYRELEGETQPLTLEENAASRFGTTT